jgi:glucose dehydrogenase
MSRKQLNRRQLIGGATAAGLAVGAFGVGAASAQDAPATPEASPVALGPAIPPEITDSQTNWAYEGYDLAATRNVQGSTISTSTVSTLGLAWTFPITAAGAFGALTANPAVVGSTIYLQDAVSNVYAIDLDSGQSVWTKEYNLAVPSGGPNGIAAAYGNLYFPVGDGELVGLNAETGEEIWHISITGPLGEGITMAPLVYDGIVYVSTIPGSSTGFYGGGQRGVIHAIDAASGAVIWYFDTTTDNLWGNPTVNSGGGLWHPPSVDDEGYLYAGVGNAAPYPGAEGWPSATSRPGPNDYANNTLSFDSKNGDLRWALNVNPHDVFDLDNQLTPILTTANIAGTDTKIAISSGKHGMVVAIDRESGKELWRRPVGKHQNDNVSDIPDTGDSLEVYPGTLGGVETPMALANGVLYVPVINLSTFYFPTKLDAAKLDFTKGSGELVAIDVNTGATIWDVEIIIAPYAAATVANDVVFTAGLDGVVRAYNTADGSAVWMGKAPAGINAPLAISGDYLLVPAGGIFAPSADTDNPAPTQANALHAFKIGAGGAATPEASPSS